MNWRIPVLVFYDAADKCWVAHCLLLGLVADGQTRDEAIEAANAICRGQVAFARVHDTGQKNLWHALPVVEAMDIARRPFEAVVVEVESFAPFAPSPLPARGAKGGDTPC